MPYEFTPEGYSQFSDAIINAGGDQATVTSILADMQGTVTDAIANSVKALADVDRISAENERLKAANMNLFLRLGEQSNARLNPDGTNITEEDGDKASTTADYMNAYFDKLDKK